MVTIGALSTGCATKQVPAVSTYTLEIDENVAIKTRQEPVFPGVLKVLIPKSSASIMSRQILYQEKQYTESSYLYSRWSEIPNKMIALKLLTYLNHSNLFKTVLPAYSKGKEDLILESNLSEFYHHINEDGSSSGRIRIKFYLIDVKNGRIVANKEFFSSTKAPSQDALGAVSALNTASQIISSEVTEWLSILHINDG